MTPKGILLNLELLHISQGDGWVSCAVKKDGGDDPDVTNGLEIYVKAQKTEIPGIRLEGGQGVGRVTKKGLEQPVGSPAINKVPRSMILKETGEICSQTGYKGGLLLTVSVPGGAEAGARTFNPRLGIQGGISILGTTGIVEPMSEKALIDTVIAEINVHRARDSEKIIITPGNYGSDFIEGYLGLDIRKAVQCSNFIGETLDYLRYAGFGKILLAGHTGKLIKLASGSLRTCWKRIFSPAAMSCVWWRHW